MSTLTLVERQTTEERLDKLFSRMVTYEQQLIEVRRDVNREAVLQEVERAMGEKGEELTKLVSDAVKALRVLVDAGVVAQEALNEAVR
jgi:CHASE3 domain sensor protein